MQHDFFESQDRTRLKCLQEKKQKLQRDLKEVQFELKQLIERGKRKPLGNDLYLSKTAVGELILYSWRPSVDKVDFFSLVELDLLQEAVQSLTQETQNEPKGLSRSNRSSTPHSPW